jgi:hypothetical protein
MIGVHPHSLEHSHACAAQALDFPGHFILVRHFVNDGENAVSVLRQEDVEGIVAALVLWPGGAVPAVAALRRYQAPTSVAPYGLRFTTRRNAFTWAGVHSSHKITGTSVIPNLRAALSLRWPSTTSPSLRARNRLSGRTPNGRARTPLLPEVRIARRRPGFGALSALAVCSQRRASRADA